MLGFEWYYPSDKKRKLLYPWTCRVCHGDGLVCPGFENEVCPVCKGVGIHVPTYRFRVWLKEWRYTIGAIKLQLGNKCISCHKQERILWFKVGNHDDCLPF